MGQTETKKPMKSRKPKNANSRMYVNVNRAKKGYRDKYKEETDKALRQFKMDMGKPEDYELTESEWRRFFRTILIPMDKERETKMIDMFRSDRDELNHLLIMHNAKAGENLAEVYFKKYQKNCPTKWYDLDDFKQLANEGLAIAAKKFDLNYKNRFLTYATWWILNRVRKPYQDKGAMLNHTSLSAPASASDDMNKTTFEEVLSPEIMNPGWDSPSGGESSSTPAETLERLNSEENHNLFAAIKSLKPNSIENLDVDKVHRMMDYLMSIVEKNADSYDNKQIFLYLFKRIFSRCSTMFKDETQRINSYISEAAPSKVELLKRLNMDEKQYEVACQRLTRGGYDGI
jgi:DNA-directed RNA polymerase specialized sigma subunit